jgi:YtxH-like protein
MNETIRDNGSHKLLMFALGATTGAVVALLSAPGSGKETRRRLRSTLQQAGVKASNVSGALADSFGRGTEVVRDGMIKAFDKDPARADSAQEVSRPGTGTEHYTPTTTPTRARQSFGNSPK